MRRRLALSILALAAGAAHAAPDDIVGPAFRHPAEGALVLLLLEKSTEPHLVPGDKLMLAQLKSQLVIAGYRTAVLDYADYQLLEADEAAGGGERDPDGRLVVGLLARQRALAKLARIAAESSHCALVIRTRFVMRPAPVVDNFFAQWDGARRALKLTDTAPRANPDGPGRTVVGALRGLGSGLSIELMAYDGDGALAFTTHGAVAVPYVTRLGEGRVEWRDDLFSGDGDVADGMRIALAPMR